MRLAALGLRQRDSVTCGPAVAVVAGALLDPARRTALQGGAPSWFAAEQARVHREVNRIWPRRLGTTPAGMARALSAQCGIGYRWRWARGRRDRLTDVLDAAGPVAMLIGAVVPRHWVLIVDHAGGQLSCYEPSSGAVLAVPPEAVRSAQLRRLGYPRAFAFVLPRGGPRCHR